MCKPHSKVTYATQQKKFITSRTVDIIRTVFYVHDA